MHAPDPEPGSNPAVYRGRNGELTMVVTIEAERCTYPGCGRPLH